MPRTLIGKRLMQAANGDQHTVLHFKDLAEPHDRRGTGLHRIDSFENDKGYRVLQSRSGQYSAWINGQWVDLVSVAENILIECVC